MILFGKSKKELLAWQKIVMTDSPDKLVLNQKQLQQISDQQASDDLRIIQDCIKLISETTKPDTFFSRLDLLKEKSAHLKTLEPYVKFSGASPTLAFDEVIKNEQEAIYQFLGRYFNFVFSKAESMKTEKGKKNQYQKFYDSLQPYVERMNEHNINYIKYKCRDCLV